MTPRLAPTAVLLVLASGCVVHRLDRNAPGAVDVRTPPLDPSLRAPLPPDDPGMQGLVVSGSASASFGAALGNGRPARATHELGLAASVLYGTARVSRDIAFAPTWDGAGGLSFGWIARSDGRTDRLFVEASGALHTSRLLGGAGWTWPAGGGPGGPQASLHAGPVFLRGAFLRGEGTILTLGVTLDPSYAVVWSR